MLRTGWTWDQLQAQPNFVIERMLVLLNARAEVANQRVNDA